jgi:tetratricopeptide (TPR) repeat protein
MIRRQAWITYPFYVIFLTITASVSGQTVNETSRAIKTYPYADPNPVPSMGVNNNIGRFYPYFMFDAYSNKDTVQRWKVVTLDNEYITVSVLPEVGGKVYGAIEKSSGHEFVYLNKVMKFRAIGSRGPWTSGGIEHNFGLDIGHAPWAASPVDYITRKKADGTVECIVGGLDLASRTQWRITISLPKNSAFFETKALLYNPTPYHHAYLSWENAAFKATDDLEFFFPGNHHIGHDGLANPWPIDEQGRDISKYKNNNFGSSKSYHVMGSTRNWFGGLWQNDNFGFGHWAPYMDAPGKKLWIWSLARDGAIWEDLLTDNDGQYIEAQSGVKFNQADVVSGYHSPFKQLSLRPGYAETKYETWFPVKGITGIVDATAAASMNVTRKDSSITVEISPNMKLADTLYVVADSKIISRTAIKLQPMKKFTTNITIPDTAKDVEVKTVVSKLKYNSVPQYINRPVVSPENYKPDDAERLFILAEDKNSMRLFDEALELYKRCLDKEPSHTGALSRIAELLYRKTEDEEAAKYALRALSINMYEPAANYIYGIIERRRGNYNEAEEAFSVAVRSFEFRSDAYRQLAELASVKNDFHKAVELAHRSLDYNRKNLVAFQVLCGALRKIGNIKDAEAVRKELLEVDPLNHFARFEGYLQAPNNETLRQFRLPIQNEFPHESYLELAVSYVALGLNSEAIKVLQLAPPHPMVYYWLAYLQKINKTTAEQITKANSIDAKFVFPFREESIPVLEYAITKSNSWKPKYYLAMIYWNKGAAAKALQLLQQCGNTPDFAPFYMSRAKLEKGDGALDDLKKRWLLSRENGALIKFLPTILNSKEKLRSMQRYGQTLQINFREML